MKKFFAILTALLICAVSSTTFADAPTCVMLKFSNDTRYKNVDSAAILSELVFEKLLASGKFNFKETKPIDKDMELMLYDEKMRDIINSQRGNFNLLFGDENFSSKYAQSVATAEVGQFVSPAITAAVGRENGAEYLIQGTIVNLGQGHFSDKFHNQNAPRGRRVFLYQKTAGVGVEVALRVIKAETGEVVWAENISEMKKTSLTQIGMFMFGTARLTTDMYSKMMDNAAKKVAEALIADLTADKLFAK